MIVSNKNPLAFDVFKENFILAITKMTLEKVFRNYRTHLKVFPVKLGFTARFLMDLTVELSFSEKIKQM